MDEYILIDITQLPVAGGPAGLVVYGVNTTTNQSVQIPFALFQVIAGQALAKAEQALDALLLKIEAEQFSETTYPEITV